MAGADRAKSLDVVLAQIEKAHGKGAVMRLGAEVRIPIDVIPTGSIALAVALGIGGLPRGRVGEFYGPASPGKPTAPPPDRHRENCGARGNMAPGHLLKASVLSGTDQ